MKNGLPGWQRDALPLSYAHFFKKILVSVFVNAINNLNLKYLIKYRKVLLNFFQNFI